MELKIFNTKKDFKEYYLDEFYKFPEVSMMEFLREYQKQFLHSLEETNSNISDLIEKKLNLSTAYYLAFKTLGIEHDQIIKIESNPLILNEIQSQLKERKMLPENFMESSLDYLSEYAGLTLDINLLKIKRNEYESILEIIEEKISNEKLYIFRPATRQNQQPENLEPLTAKQKEKIGLLIRTGIVDLLTDKYKANPNQLANFFDLLTKERLKAPNTNPHFSENNAKYAIQNKEDKTDLDVILKGIFKNAII